MSAMHLPHSIPLKCSNTRLSSWFGNFLEEIGAEGFGAKYSRHSWLSFGGDQEWGLLGVFLVVVVVFVFVFLCFYNCLA